MLLLKFLLALLTIYEISTQTYVYGRPSPPAVDHLPATAEPETSPSRTIPGLTPEESADVVEKILRGELQPVMKTDELKSLPSDVTEVPVPIPPAKTNTNMVDTPEQTDGPLPYIESPQTSAMFPMQILPNVQTPYPVKPSVLRPFDGGVGTSPANYPPIDKSTEKENLVKPAESIYNPKNDNGSSRAQNLLLDSTLKSQVLPESEDTGFEGNKPVPPKRSLPSVSTTNSALEGQTLSLNPTTSVLRETGKDSDVSLGLSSDVQDLPRSDVTNISYNNTGFTDSTVPLRKPPVPPRMSVQDVPKTGGSSIRYDIPAYPKNSKSFLYIEPTDDSVLHGQKIPVNTGSIDSYVFPEKPSVPPRMSVQELQDLPKTVDTSISYDIPADPKGTVPVQPTDVPVLNEHTIKPLKDLSDVQDNSKSSSLSGMPTHNVEDLTGISEIGPASPKNTVQSVSTDNSDLGGPKMPIMLTKTSSDVQDIGKVFPVSQDLPGMAPSLPQTIKNSAVPDQFVSSELTSQILPTGSSVFVNSADRPAFQDDSPVSQDVSWESNQDVPNIPGLINTDSIKDLSATSQSEPNGDLVLDREVIPSQSVGLQLNNDGNNVQDFLNPADTEAKIDMATNSESYAPKVANLTENVNYLSGRPPGVPIVPTRKVQSNTRGLPISSFRNFKQSPLIDPRNALNIGLQPGKKVMPRNVENPSKNGNKLEEDFALDPIIQFRDSQPSADYRGKLSLEELENPYITRKVVTPRKDISDFLNVDPDLSDVLDSEPVSRSIEYPWSTEESDEDDEFWKKMKRFINNENVRNSPVVQPDEIQSDEIQPEIMTPPYISVGNINAMPSSETKSNEIDDLHVMKIPRSMQNDTVLDERSELDVNLEKAQDRNSEISGDFPVEESSTLFFNDEFSPTESTTPEDLLLDDTLNVPDMEVGDFLPDDLTTTEGPLNYAFSPTEGEDYGEEPMMWDSTTVKNYQPDEEFAPDEEDTTDIQMDSTPKYEDDKPVDVLDDQNFQEESSQRFTPEDIFSNSRDVLQGSVGGPDDVRQLRNDPVLPQDDPRFTESAKETFTTDEPLLAEEDEPVDYPVNSTISVVEQGAEIPPSKPTDLNLIEAENPTPAPSSSGHFVSKKDDPLNTVAYLLKSDKNHKPLHKNKIIKILPGVPSIAKDELISPPSDDESSITNTRVRRSNKNITALPEELGFNSTSKSVNPVPPSPDFQSVISTVTPSISKPQTSALPTSIKSKKSPNYLTTSAVTHLPHTTPVTPSFSTSTVTHAPSTQSTTSIPSTTPVTLPPSTMSTTPAPSTTSTTLDPPTTYELLPTPVPETSTPTTLLTSTTSPTNSTTPKKKKKKMVWKIPFNPNNIAITSSGEVRLEPKDKTATTTTEKPHLRDRLKPEDLQAARERLLKRFHFKRPAVIPIPDTAKLESLRHPTGQPSLLKVPNPSLTGEQAGKLSVRPAVDEDVLAYVTAQDPSQLPSLLYNSPEEREEARKRRLRTMVGLAGDVRSLLSERARHAVKTVGSIVGGGDNKKENH